VENDQSKPVIRLGGDKKLHLERKYKIINDLYRDLVDSIGYGEFERRSLDGDAVRDVD